MEQKEHEGSLVLNEPFKRVIRNKKFPCAKTEAINGRNFRFNCCARRMLLDPWKLGHNRCRVEMLQRNSADDSRFELPLAADAGKRGISVFRLFLIFHFEMNLVSFHGYV